MTKLYGNNTGEPNMGDPSNVNMGDPSNVNMGEANVDQGPSIDEVD